MFTSDTKTKMTHSLVGYFGTTVFLFVFYLVYKNFAFGEDSEYMRCAFMAPLFGGLIIMTFMALTSKGMRKYRLFYNLWNSGIALVVAGCLTKGVVEMSGRDADCHIPYFIAAGVMFLASVAVFFGRLSYRQKKIEQI